MPRNRNERTDEEIREHGIAYAQNKIDNARTEEERAKWERVKGIVEGRDINEIYPDWIIPEEPSNLGTFMANVAGGWSNSLRRKH